MGKSVQAPPSPDYAAAATAQGAANTDAAKQSLGYSNPNIFTPYGSQTMGFTYNPLTGQDDYPQIFQSLTPTGQATVDQQQATQLGLSKLANEQTGAIGGILNTPFSFSGQPQTSLGTSQPINFGGVDPGQYQASGAPINAGPIAGGPNAGNYATSVNPAFQAAQGAGPAPGLQGQIDTSGIAKMPINAGTTAQQAIMSRLEPQMARARTSAETNLTNQGLRPGGEAYTNAMTDLGQQENDQRTQAVLQGLGLDLSANQQGFNQAQASGEFGNNAAMAGYGAALQGQGLTNAAYGQNFGQSLAGQQAANSATNQNFQNQLAGQQAQNAAQQQNYGQLYGNQQQANAATQQNYGNLVNNQLNQNAAQQQGFAQQLAGGQFGNTAQQQALAQQMAIRNLPINEITALLSGGQVQNPQFQGYQGTSVQPAPVFQGVQAQGAWDQNQYNQQVAQQNAMMQGLFGLGGAAIGAVPFL